MCSYKQVCRVRKKSTFAVPQLVLTSPEKNRNFKSMAVLFTQLHQLKKKTNYASHKLFTTLPGKTHLSKPFGVLLCVNLAIGV